MKKICFLGLCLFACMTISAQTSLVKDVEHQLKNSNPNYVEALKNIQPALENAETSGTMMPWYLAGKAAFGIYDNVMIKEQLAQPVTDAEKKAAGKALVDGYKYYFTALQLDSIPDEKGKIKPKKSKEIKKLLSSTYGGTKNAGIYLFDTHDYPGAYDAWELYVTLPENPLLGKDAPQSDPDTIVGMITFYQAVSMLSIDDNQRALDKVKQTIEKGYNTIDVYRYGVESARRLNDTISMLDIAHKGYELYGTQDIAFVGQMINDKLAKGDYKACYALVEDALANTPDESKAIKAQLYNIEGFICEQEEKFEDAVVNYDKAVAMDPEFAQGYYNLGRMYYNRAVKLDEVSEGTRDSEVVPDLLKAADYYEKAYQLDEAGLTQIPSIMYRLYYRLGAGYEDKMQMWQNM